MEKTKEIDSLALQITDAEQLAQAAAFNAVRGTGDYESSEKLLQVARDLHAISRRVESLAAMERGSTERRIGSRLGGEVLGRRRKRPAYPRFEVSEDRIVKVGRGKSKAAKEYRHEAPKESFESLMSWIDETRRSGRKEWLAQDAVEGLTGEVPSYQIYLMLGALRESGTLRAVKKGSYEVAEDWLSASECWNMLRSRTSSDEGEEEA